MVRTPDELTDDFLDGDPLLTTTEVARMLRVDPKTVTRWAKAGRIPAAADERPGAFQILDTRHWRIRRSSVQAIVNAPGDQWQEDDPG